MKTFSRSINEPEDLIAYAMSFTNEDDLKNAIILANKIIEGKLNKFDVQKKYMSTRGYIEWIGCRDTLLFETMDIIEDYKSPKVNISNELDKELEELTIQALSTKDGVVALVKSCESYYDDYIDDNFKNPIKYWKIIAKSIDVAYSLYESKKMKKNNVNLGFNKPEEVIACAMASIDKKELKKAEISATKIIEGRYDDDELTAKKHRNKRSGFELINCKDLIMFDSVMYAKIYGGPKVNISDELKAKTKELLRKTRNTKDGFKKLIDSCESYYNDYIDDNSKDLIKYWKIIAKCMDITCNSYGL